MAACDPWPPPDPLGEALHLLRMDGAFYSRCELTAPRGMTLTPMAGHVWFHVVTHGRVLLETDGAPAAWLQPGDCALVPHGDGRRLRSDPGAPAPDILGLPLEPVSERYEILRHGGGGAPTDADLRRRALRAPRGAHHAGDPARLITVEATDGPARGVHGAARSG
jgi:hypothetical protein